ncbi:MAG: hypothetical protein IJH04_09810 [Eggerthellaceae bacterium]|nr:hypothetical protein [Eggerthellaceae bacterium]
MKNLVIAAALTATIALAAVLAGCGGTASNVSSAASASATGAAPAASASATSAAAADTSSADTSSAADSFSSTQQGRAIVQINIEGMGEIAWAYENEEPAFDGEHPYQSAYVGDALGQTILIEANENASCEGSRFSQWNKDGKKFSEDKRIDVLVDGDAQYVAVFELEG